jgi:hypothetical protein
VFGESNTKGHRNVLFVTLVCFLVRCTAFYAIPQYFELHAISQILEATMKESVIIIHKIKRLDPLNFSTLQVHHVRLLAQILLSERDLSTALDTSR